MVSNPSYSSRSRATELGCSCKLIKNADETSSRCHPRKRVVRISVLRVITVKAVRGDNQRSTLDFHHSPPKRVNYGEGENRVNVDFDRSPLQGVKMPEVASC